MRYLMLLILLIGCSSPTDFDLVRQPLQLSGSCVAKIYANEILVSQLHVNGERDTVSVAVGSRMDSRSYCGGTWRYQKWIASDEVITLP